MKLKAKCFEIISSNGEDKKIRAREDALKVAGNSDAIVEMIYDATGYEKVKFKNGSMYLLLGNVDEDRADEIKEELVSVLSSDDFKSLVKSETSIVQEDDLDEDQSDEELLSLTANVDETYLKISDKVLVME